jgi:hypothetical protein
MKTVVCDAGPIIHLYEAHCLALLRLFTCHSSSSTKFKPPST